MKQEKSGFAGEITEIGKIILKNDRYFEDIFPGNFPCKSCS